MDKFKNYTILGLIGVIVIILLFRQCGVPTSKETYIKGETIVQHDTILTPYKVTEFKKIYYPKWDTIKTADTTWNADLCRFERTYSDSLSNDSITIYLNQETIGILKSSRISYRWKAPSVITTLSRTDTLIRPPKFQLYLNSTIGGNQDRLNIYTGATIIHKRIEAGYSYGLLDKSHNIRVGLRLFKSKK